MSFNQFPMRFGKYIVLDRISAGGMAEVYRAKEIRESGFSRVIAIKRMLDGIATDATMAPMFVDEAKLAAQLVHPNIAQTLELGRIDDDLYIAMELVWGRDLKAISKACSAKHIPFPVAIACYIVAKAAEALDFAHNANGPDGKPMRLVHRDVSPHNLMIDYDGEVKVIDFGVAKAEAKSSETVAGVIKGKFSYMAPEQVTGVHVDARTDVFALGIVLFELISGERLYDGSSAFSIFDKVVNQPAPRLSSVTQVVADLDDIVARCLAKRPEDRFENAAQLADALAPFRIQERSIVGPRETKALLKQLYPNDETDMREKVQRYQEIREIDCVDARAAVGPLFIGKTQILASSDVAPQYITSGTQGTAAPTAMYHALSHSPELAATPIRPSERLSERSQRPTADIEPPRPRRTLAVVIGLLALAAGAVVVTAQVKRKTPVALVQDLLKRPTIVQPTPDGPTIAANPNPPAVATLEVTAVEPTSHPLPTITTSAQPPSTQTPRPQVGTLEPQIAEHPTTRTPRQPITPKPPLQPKEPSSHGFGFVAIGSKGWPTAKVFIDGKEIGYAPIHWHKLPLGSHTVKLIPIKDEKPGKPVTQTIEVGKDTTDKAPLRLVVHLEEPL